MAASDPEDRRFGEKELLLFVLVAIAVLMGISAFVLVIGG
jgi:hypothetical protein